MSTENAKLRLELEATLARFEQEMRRAINSGVVTASTLEKRFDLMSAKMSRSANRGAQGLSNVMNVSRQGRFVLQNTANQLGDIAVQLEAGTNPARVMGQQLPQIFGGFAALGGTLGIVGPLLGTVAAVGLPVAAMAMSVGNETEKSAAKVKTFADKLNDAESALRRAESALKLASTGGIEDLRKTYGEVTREVTELADALADIEVRAAQVKVREVLDDVLGGKLQEKVTQSVGPIAGGLMETSQADIAALRDEIALLEQELRHSLTPKPETQAALTGLRQELALMLGDLENAGSLSDMIEVDPQDIAQLYRLRELVKEIPQALEGENFALLGGQMSELRAILAQLGIEVREGFLAEFTQAESIVRQTAENLRTAEDNAAGVTTAASGLPGTVGSAADEAARLASNLGAAMAQLNSVVAGIHAANRKALTLAKIKMETIGQPVERAGRIARAEFNESSGAAAYAMIRSGNVSKLSELNAAAGRIQDQAEQVAAAEESLRAAEKTYAEELRKSRGAGGGKGSGGKKAKKDAPGFFDGIDREIESLERQISMVGKNRSEIAALTAEYRLLDEAKKKGIDLDAASLIKGKSVADVIRDKAQAVARLSEQLDRGKLSQQGFERGIKGIADSIAAATVNGENFGESMVQVLRSIAQEIISSNVQRLILSLSGGTGGGGNLVGTLLGVSARNLPPPPGPPVVPKLARGQVLASGPKVATGPVDVRVSLDVAASEDLRVVAARQGEKAGARAAVAVGSQAARVQREKGRRG